MSRNRVRSFGSLIVVACLILVGCGSPTDEVTASVEGGIDFKAYFLDRAGVALENARDELGMSEDTYMVYLEIADRGYVLASDIQRVMPEFIACIEEDVGFEVIYDPSVEGFFGLPTVTWGLLVPGGNTSVAEDLLIEACSTRTVALLTTLFFNQPYSPERNDAWLADDRREASRDCLEEAGYFVSDTASFQDYLELAKRAADETGDSTCLELVLYGEVE